jgi:hypothetical protein
MAKSAKPKNGNGHVPSVPHLIDTIGGPSVFGRICGFKRNPGPRGSDMRRRGFIPIEYWPAILAYGRKEQPAGFTYVTWKSLAEAHLRRELPN